MRKEDDLNVPNDVHSQTIDARRRTNNGSGRLQGVLHKPQPKWFERFFKWETNLIVGNKIIEKGWVVPQPLGIALLLVMISGTGVLYWRIIDKQAVQEQAFSEKLDREHEILIRLDQKLTDKNEHDADFKRETKDKLELQDLQIKDVKDKLLVLNTKAR